MKKFKTIGELKEFTIKNGSNYFAKKTMKKFKSRILYLYSNNIFVERYSINNGGSYRYNVGIILPNGHVELISKNYNSNTFYSLYQAEVFAKNLSYAFRKNLGNREKLTLENLTDISRKKEYNNYLVFTSDKLKGDSHSFILNDNFEVVG